MTLNSWDRGTEVNTPDGKGRIGYVRRAPPNYTEAEAVSVVLDKYRNNPTYTGTIYPACQVYTGPIKPFVCTKSKLTGECTFTKNSEGYDPRLLNDGTIGYEIIGYADTVEEAQKIIYGRAYIQEPKPVFRCHTTFVPESCRRGLYARIDSGEYTIEQIHKEGEAPKPGIRVISKDREVSVFISDEEVKTYGELTKK